MVSKEMKWLDKLVQSGAQHYTCTSNKALEATPGSEREAINYAALAPLVVERLGRQPADYAELVIVSEQLIRQAK